MSGTCSVAVLDKTLELLGALAERPAQITEVSAATGIPRSTTARLVHTLEQHQMVIREHTGRFRLGPRLAELARAAGEDPLVAAAQPVLDALRTQFGHAAQVFRWEAGARLCIAASQVASRSCDDVRSCGESTAAMMGRVCEPTTRCSPRGLIPVGAIGSMRSGAAAQVLVAFAPVEVRYSATRRATFSADNLASVRQLGWAQALEGRRQDLATVAAPVRAPEGTVVAALALTGRSALLGQHPGLRFGPIVARAAACVSARFADQLSREANQEGE